MSGGPGPVVVVGAGLAGLRAATALRDLGYAGGLTLVGDEPHPPYDRPPLSKEVLTGRLPAAAAELPLPSGLDARLVLGRAAVRLDRAARTVVLDDGTPLRYGGLVVATGASAAPWPGPGVPPERGVHLLRGRRDAVALRGALLAGGPVLVAGGGFLGCEVASAARSMGLPVTLVDPAGSPLEAAVGPAAGSFMAAVQADAGVDLRMGATVAELPDHRGSALLSDGTRVAARTVVLALGARPNTAWLRGSGLGLDPVSGALLCDGRRRALDHRGSPVPGIVALGDAAAAPHPFPGPGAPAHLALGHWSEAVDHAATAAAALLGGAPPREPGVPSFWSDQFGLRIRSVGVPRAADTAEVLEHDLPNRRLEVVYRRGGRTVGALTVGRTSRLAAHRRRIARGLAGQEVSTDSGIAVDRQA
ncbi:NAD(P)/FAD-dependent oxidoreductase [Nocardiopsis changdeensis]|uniref:FAD-dependent oxidoreductase n=1 Tax=Nocardiopsis changdeensis TaxID=2831969 RepID=A0ABX8BL23_9ACTN|nr:MULTISPECIES: FAD-dependent oxidoreductase [Nocardiopsis]QUX21113.1 FAD-dependent oxidoreductase [Nocardiopsis changdeensis]QYX37042.1 FAD-dependent oxidoreductase [Nocardiopsis sp. MT53]